MFDLGRTFLAAVIANAVADALGVAEVGLPLTPERLLEMVSRRGK